MMVPKGVKRLCLALSFCIPQILTFAQTTKVTGVITDAATGETLPFVNVAFIDSKISTVSDLDGNFVLDTYYATDSLRAIAVGFVPVTYAVKKDREQVIDIKMNAGVELTAVVIRPPDENPAFPILRKVVQHKPVNNREKLEAYEYDAYNKVEFDINNITEKFTQKKLFKPFAFIFDNIDSTDAKPYLPIFMTETLSEVYYRQKPKTQKEFIRGTKVSGIENESVSQFLGDMYQNVNIYENFLVIFGKNFISPIADGGRGYYDYYLADSAYYDKFWCYKIEFKPKRVQELAFKGTMWINDTTYAVKHVEAGIAEGANLNFVQAFKVEQEYDQVQNEVWMLTRDELVVDLNVVNDKLLKDDKPVQGFYGRRTATYRNFSINKPREPEFYDGVDQVIVEIDPLSLGADYWDTNRHIQLTAKEDAIYKMVDTMKTIPRFRTYVDLITTLVTGYYVKGKVELGPYSSIFSFNQVEGPRLRLGLRTSNTFSTWVEFEGFTAYGFKDERFKYGLATRGFISKHPRLLYRAAYKHDVEQLGAGTNAFVTDNLLGSVFRRGPNNKLTDVEEWMVGLEREWFSGFSNELRFRFRTLQALGSLSYEHPVFEPVFSVETVGSLRSAEVSLNTHFTYKEKFVSGEFDRISVGYNKFPTLEMHLAYGIPGFLESDYEYTKVIGRIYKRWQLGTLGWSRTTLEGGRVFGQLPYPLLIIHTGNETWYYNDAAFNTMNFFEFLSDRYIQLFAEHHFDGLFFNRIPLLRRLKFREVVTFKAVAGDLDPKHSEELLLLPGMYTLSNGPFMEASAGIENILKVLRVDVVWRLRYNDHPNTAPFAIRGKFVFNF
ncbi:MAG: carboxypeptidase-like regulatory domain-containing protein [Flavobacteriales bacterium]|nr:carboxypeptidase-like regulatory domain-containing protein [Flavobacteriales bacterium]